MKKTILLAIALIFFVAPNGIAQEETLTTRTSQQRIADRSARIEAITDAVRDSVIESCSRVETILTAATQESEEVRNRRERIYSSIQSSLADITLTATDANLDTTNLSKATASLDVQLEAFFADFDVYEAALADAGSLDCTTETDDFYNAVVDARQQRRTLKGLSLEIRTFVQSDIRGVLADLRTQFNSQSERGA